MKNSFWLFIAGCFSLLGGMFALAHPFAASLTAEQIAGWSFIVVGVVAMVFAFRTPQAVRRKVFRSGHFCLACWSCCSDYIWYSIRYTA